MIDIQNVDYSTQIPNNVGLTEDRQVLRALERWHPGYLDWWQDMGPEGFQEVLVYLRTAISVDPKGWAKFDYVRMPEYRWGVLLAPKEEGRKVNFGAHLGEPAWQEVPGEYRAMLRRLIVVQGDTEPASVEQQRHLGKTAPSLYDMRNLFQVNVEEGRHLWAMVYLLQKYFGRDGREEADELLRRRSGSEDARACSAPSTRRHPIGSPSSCSPSSPIVTARCSWNAGAIGLRSLVSHLPLHADRRSAPHVRRRDRGRPHHPAHLRSDEGSRYRGSERDRQGSRTRRGRPADACRKSSICTIRCRSTFSAPRSRPTLPTSTTPVLRAVFRRPRSTDDHRLTYGSYPVAKLWRCDQVVDEPALTALNMRLRDDYTRIAPRGSSAGTRSLRKKASNFRLDLPHMAFNRRVGEFRDVEVSSKGRRVSSGCVLGGRTGRLSAFGG